MHRRDVRSHDRRDRAGGDSVVAATTTRRSGESEKPSYDLRDLRDAFAESQGWGGAWCVAVCRS
jgi:hypothetical protein